MHAEWLCYDEVHRLVGLFVQWLCHSLENLLLSLGKIKAFVLVFTHRKRGVSRLDARVGRTQTVTGACRHQNAIKSCRDFDPLARARVNERTAL